MGSYPISTASYATSVSYATPTTYAAPATYATSYSLPTTTYAAPTTYATSSHVAHNYLLRKTSDDNVCTFGGLNSGAITDDNLCTIADDDHGQQLRPLISDSVKRQQAAVMGLQQSFFCIRFDTSSIIKLAHGW